MNSYCRGLHGVSFTHRVINVRIENYTVPISSSSQSSIAAMKNVLADGDLLPSPPLSGTPTDHPYTLSILYLLGWSVGVQGRGRGAGPVWVPNSSSLYTLFYSVIYNSVAFLKLSLELQRLATVCPVIKGTHCQTHMVVSIYS